MKFKILKEVDNTGTWYWTIPQGFLNKLWFMHNPLSGLIYIDTQNPWDVWLSQSAAEQHIKRWNEGDYKKRYNKEFIKYDDAKEVNQE